MDLSLVSHFLKMARAWNRKASPNLQKWTCGESWGCLGRVLRQLESVLGALGGVLGRLGKLLGRLGKLLEPSKVALDQSWKGFGASWRCPGSVLEGSFACFWKF